MRSTPPIKIKDQVPEGLLVNRAWLKAKGATRPLVDYYLRSGALEAVARGIYRRPGPPLKWQHVVYSLQELGYNIHVGGRTALELQGMAHYLPMQGISTVLLYGVNKLPGWVEHVSDSFKLELRRPRLFFSLPVQAITTEPFGHWDWPLRMAKPELALLQLLAEVKNGADFEVAESLMDSASNLRPQLLMHLLTECHHVLAKRLFLWFAERHQHSWLNKIEFAKVDLGSGKRMVVKNGTLDKKYLITVPKGMLNGSDQSVF